MQPQAQTPDLKALVERVEKLTKPDRKTDALIEIVARKIEAYRVLPDPKTHAVWRPMRGLAGAVESQGTRYAAQDFTRSLDQALALCERVLPGWRRQFNEDGESAWWASVLLPDVSVGRPAGYCTNASLPTPALALLSAMLRALIATQETV